MGTLKRGRTDTDTYTTALIEASKDAAGRFVGAGCAALPALVLSLIETCLRIARKLKLLNMSSVLMKPTALLHLGLAANMKHARSLNL